MKLTDIHQIHGEVVDLLKSKFNLDAYTKLIENTLAKNYAEVNLSGDNWSNFVALLFQNFYTSEKLSRVPKEDIEKVRSLGTRFSVGDNKYEILLNFKGTGYQQNEFGVGKADLYLESQVRDTQFECFSRFVYRWGLDKDGFLKMDTIQVTNNAPIKSLEVRATTNLLNLSSRALVSHKGLDAFLTEVAKVIVGQHIRTLTQKVNETVLNNANLLETTRKGYQEAINTSEHATRSNTSFYNHLATVSQLYSDFTFESAVSELKVAHPKTLITCYLYDTYSVLGVYCKWILEVQSYTLINLVSTFKSELGYPVLESGVKHRTDYLFVDDPTARNLVIKRVDLYNGEFPSLSVRRLYLPVRFDVDDVLTNVLKFRTFMANTYYWSEQENSFVPFDSKPYDDLTFIQDQLSKVLKRMQVSGLSTE